MFLHKNSIYSLYHFVKYLPYKFNRLYSIIEFLYIYIYIYSIYIHESHMSTIYID